MMRAPRAPAPAAERQYRGAAASQGHRDILSSNASGTHEERAHGFEAPQRSSLKRRDMQLIHTFSCPYASTPRVILAARSAKIPRDLAACKAGLDYALRQERWPGDIHELAARLRCRARARTVKNAERSLAWSRRRRLTLTAIRRFHVADV